MSTLRQLQKKKKLKKERKNGWIVGNHKINVLLCTKILSHMRKSYPCTINLCTCMTKAYITPFVLSP